MKQVVVIGAGIGGLSAAALLGAAGHRVVVLDASDHFGGKSWRIELRDQLLDTGPSLFTFPGVWAELLRRFDSLRSETPGRRSAAEIAALEFERLSDVGTYCWGETKVTLPVPPGHPWHEAWKRFEAQHGSLGGDITRLLTTPPLERKAFPSLAKLASVYGPRLTTRSYLDGLDWMPEGLREVIAIHTLNAGVGPSRTPALYASMPAVMARDGVFVPRGGVNELVGALHRLGEEVGVEYHASEPVVRLGARRVVTAKASYSADVVVSGIDDARLNALLRGSTSLNVPRRSSCSAVGIYSVLSSALPAGTPRHSVILPEDPSALYTALEMGEEPEQTMVFANYYPAREVNSNNLATLALLLTAPANNKAYELDDPFVIREFGRATKALGLDRPIESYLEETKILDPAYFAKNGSTNGAIFGAVYPLWMSGPFHVPRHRSMGHRWLWRVGASVHPGGGLPAVMGGALMTTGKMLNRMR